MGNSQGKQHPRQVDSPVTQPVLQPPKTLFQTSNTSNYLHLSKTQISSVRVLWNAAQAKGKDEPGRSILKVLFAKEPMLRIVFGFGYSSGHSLADVITNTSDYGAHSARFTEVLGKIVANLETLDEVEPLLLDLGAKHVNFRQAGFEIQYWDVFAEAVIEKTLEWGTRHQRTVKTQEAWSKIVLYMVDKLKQGYHAAVRTPSPTASASE